MPRTASVPTNVPHLPSGNISILTSQPTLKANNKVTNYQLSMLLTNISLYLSESNRTYYKRILFSSIHSVNIIDTFSELNITISEQNKKRVLRAVIADKNKKRDLKEKIYYVKYIIKGGKTEEQEIKTSWISAINDGKIQMLLRNSSRQHGFLPMLWVVVISSAQDTSPNLSSSLSTQHVCNKPNSSWERIYALNGYSAWLILLCITWIGIQVVTILIYCRSSRSLLINTRSLTNNSSEGISSDFESKESGPETRSSSLDEDQKVIITTKSFILSTSTVALVLSRLVYCAVQLFEWETHRQDYACQELMLASPLTEGIPKAKMRSMYALTLLFQVLVLTALAVIWKLTMIKAYNPLDHSPHYMESVASVLSDLTHIWIFLLVMILLVSTPSRIISDKIFYIIYIILQSSYSLLIIWIIILQISFSKAGTEFRALLRGNSIAIRRIKHYAGRFICFLTCFIFACISIVIMIPDIFTSAYALFLLYSFILRLLEMSICTYFVYIMANKNVFENHVSFESPSSGSSIENSNDDSRITSSSGIEVPMGEGNRRHVGRLRPSDHGIIRTIAYHDTSESTHSQKDKVRASVNGIIRTIAYHDTS